MCSERASNTDTPRENIIVVGDWFVDEHWVTGVHRSSSASRTGQSHHRAIQVLDSTIEAFCGAGRTASLLYQVREDGEPAFSIYGIGIWHKEDKDTLKSMFDFKNLEGQNHHRSSRKEMAPPPGVHLYNLGKIIRDRPVGTSRIIRIYHAASDQRIQYSRVDWELEGRYHEKYGPPMRALDPGKTEIFLTSIIQEARQPDPHRDTEGLPEAKEVQAVVLKDLRRGVVSQALVAWFAERYKDVPWFVSTKTWGPGWLDELKHVNLRVLLIPQVAARQAIESGDLGCWITRAGYPEQSAMDIINQLAERTIDEKRAREENGYRPRIIVLPEGFRVLARDPFSPTAETNGAESIPHQTNRSPEQDACVQEHVSIGPLDVDMGMASVFLPALVALLVGDPNLRLKELVEGALRHTYKWVRYEGQRITDPNNWPGTQIQAFMSGQTTDPPVLNTNEFSWEKEQETWKRAMGGTGVVEINGSKELQLWRSMVEIDGYACCVLAKKKKIYKLMRGIEAFSRSGRPHHVCCMLVASPGSGKTFFVRQLAKTLDFHFLSFNITQMLSRSDILDCFDTIVTTQAQNPDRPLLVFVDEINARLEGDLVYNAFLAPIEEGIYVRGGKVFHIAPCVWVFSGTEDPASPNGHDRDRSLKGSDFKSRLTLGVLEIDRGETRDRVQTENVYRGVAMIREEFPDVRYVSEGVLKLLSCMRDNVSTRMMKNFVKSFANIQYGKVLTNNIPWEAVETLGTAKAFDMQLWKRQKDTGEGDDVAIVPF